MQQSLVLAAVVVVFVFVVFVVFVLFVEFIEEIGDVLLIPREIETRSVNAILSCPLASYDFGDTRVFCNLRRRNYDSPNEQIIIECHGRDHVTVKRSRKVLSRTFDQKPLTK